VEGGEHFSNTCFSRAAMSARLAKIPPVKPPAEKARSRSPEDRARSRYEIWGDLLWEVYPRCQMSFAGCGVSHLVERAHTNR